MSDELRDRLARQAGPNEVLDPGPAWVRGRRRRRAKRAMAGGAAALLVVAGIGIAGAVGGSDGPQRQLTAGPSTTEDAPATTVDAATTTSPGEPTTSLAPTTEAPVTTTSPPEAPTTTIAELPDPTLPPTPTTIREVPLGPAWPDPTDPEPGADATWSVDPANPPTSGSTQVSVLVERGSCSNGYTGQVLRPGVRWSADEVVVTYTVAPIEEGTYTCPSNERVPVTLDLGQALGDRKLVDSYCLDPAKEYYSDCLTGGVRWPTS